MRIDRRLALWVLNHVPLGPFERYSPRLLAYALNAKRGWRRDE